MLRLKLCGSPSAVLNIQLCGYPTILAFNAEGNIVAISPGYGGRTPADVLEGEAQRITRH